MVSKAELPEMTMLNLYKAYTLVTTFCAVSAMTCEMYSLIFLTLANGCEFELTGAQQYLAMAVPVFGMLASGQLWEYLGDTFGRKRTLYASIKMAFVLSLFCIISTDFKKYVFFKLMSSTLVSGAWRMSKGLLSDFLLESRRYINLLVTNAIVLLTCGILTGLTWLILEQDFYFDIPHFPFQLNSWRLMYLLCCFPTALCNIAARLVIETSNNCNEEKTAQKTCEVLHQMVELQENNYNETLIRSLVLKTKFLVTNPSHCCLRKSKPQDMFSRTKIEKKYSYLISFLVAGWLICVFSDVMTPLLAITYLSVPYESAEPNKTVCEIIDETFKNTNFSFQNAFSRKMYISNACSKMRLQADPDIYILDLNLNELGGYFCLLAFINTIVNPVFNVVFVKMNYKFTILTFTIGKKCFYGAIQVATSVLLNSINSSSTSYKIGAILLVYVMCVLTLCMIANYKLNDFYNYLTGMSAIMFLMACFSTGRFGDRIMTDLKSDNCENVLDTYAGVCFTGIILTIFLPTEMDMKRSHPMKCTNTHTHIIQGAPKDIETTYVDQKN